MISAGPVNEQHESQKPATRSAHPVAAPGKSNSVTQRVSRTLMQGAWRNHLPIHPAANRIPEATIEEKRALAGDLAKHGQRVPVVLVRVAGGPVQVLDGRHRLDLLEGVGAKVVDEIGKILVLHDIIDVSDDAAAEALSLSLNAHRRQLTLGKRRELLRAQLVAAPQMSDRKIGEVVGFSHTAVANQRKKMEADGSVASVATVVGKDERSQKRAKKKKAQSKQEQQKNPDRDDIGSKSASEVARLRARNEELEHSQALLKRQVTGLQAEVDDLRKAVDPDAEEVAPPGSTEKNGFFDLITALVAVSNQPSARTVAFETLKGPPPVTLRQVENLISWLDDLRKMYQRFKRQQKVLT
jgi:ParB-like chromosome segregation protein Spo0J